MKKRFIKTSRKLEEVQCDGKSSNKNIKAPYKYVKIRKLALILGILAPFSGFCASHMYEATLASGNNFYMEVKYFFGLYLTK